MSPSPFSNSLLSGTKGVSHLMYFSCPSPGESHFFKKPRFLLMENNINKARSVFRVLLLPGPLNVCINHCMYVHTRIYTCLIHYLPAYLPMSICLPSLSSIHLSLHVFLLPSSPFTDLFYLSIHLSLSSVISSSFPFYLLQII